MISGNFLYNYRQRRIALEAEMLRDAQLILDSVDFLEKEINKKFLELEKAQAHNKQEKVEALKLQLFELLSKLSEEEKHMDAYLVKYNHFKVPDEEEILLSSIGSEESFSLRGFSPHQKGIISGACISGTNR